MYIANDGTQFEDGYECKEYEFNLLKKGADFVMFNQKAEMTDELEDCFFINIKNQQALDYLTNYGGYEGYAVPTDIGSFYYSEDDNRWYNLKDKIDELEKELTFLKSVMK